MDLTLPPDPLIHRTSFDIHRPGHYGMRALAVF